MYYIAIGATCNKKRKQLKRLKRHRISHILKTENLATKERGKKRKDPDSFDVHKMIV